MLMHSHCNCRLGLLGHCASGHLWRDVCASWAAEQVPCRHQDARVSGQRSHLQDSLYHQATLARRQASVPGSWRVSSSSEGMWRASMLCG